MIEPKTTTIDGLEVTVQAWPARKAWKRQVTLGKIFRKSLTELGAAVESKQEGTSVDLSRLGSALENVFDTLSEEKSEEVLLMLLSGVRVDNAELTSETIDLLFQGKILTMYKIIALVLEVNYGSFLPKGGIGNILK